MREGVENLGTVKAKMMQSRPKPSRIRVMRPHIESARKDLLVNLLINGPTQMIDGALDFG